MAHLSRSLIVGCTIALAGAAAPGSISPLCATACAQTDEGDVKAKRQNLALLLRPISVNFEDQRFEDVMTFIQDFTGADFDIHYANDRKPNGLDRDALIKVNAREMTALRLLELVLEQSARDTFEESTWQMTKWGSIEVGPKSLLNRRQRVVIYDIADLLFELPDYEDAPDIDLQNVLQNTGGGGGGQSPFDGDTNDEDEERDLDERRNEVIDLIQAIVEPEQWVDNGGDGGTIQIFQNTLVIKAPDYIHRQIDGYRWWPSKATTIAGTGARRYVSFNLDTGIGTVDGFESYPVPAVVGGDGGGGDGGNGGGGGGGG
jgi:hypothetical protein